MIKTMLEAMAIEWLNYNAAAIIVMLDLDLNLVTFKTGSKTGDKSASTFLFILKLSDPTGD